MVDQSTSDGVEDIVHRDAEKGKAGIGHKESDAEWLRGFGPSMEIRCRATERGGRGGTHPFELNANERDMVAVNRLSNPTHISSWFSSYSTALSRLRWTY